MNDRYDQNADYSKDIFDEWQLFQYDVKYFDVYDYEVIFRILGDSTCEMGPYCYDNQYRYSGWFDDFAGTPTSDDRNVWVGRVQLHPFTNQGRPSSTSPIY